MNAPPSRFAVNPEDLRIPDDLPAPDREKGGVVLLVAGEEARERGWSARAAVELARRWGAEGHRVFLADGDLSEAPLHELAGGENGEGVADVILHGASPGRVGQRADGFLFAAAGTVVADPSAVFAHPRWTSVLSAFRESGSVFLLYAPSDVSGTALGREADQVIHLTETPEGTATDGEIVLYSDGDREPTSPGEAPSAAVEEPPREPRSGTRKRKARERQANRSRLLLLVLLLLVAAAALLGEWMGYFELGLGELLASAGAAGSIDSPASG